MLVGLIGKAKAINEQAWAKHQAYMWEQFDSPEAQARSTAEIDAIINRVREETPDEASA